MLKKILGLAALLCLMGVGIGCYAFGIEPKRLVQESIALDVSKTENPKKIKIIQFSDTHLGKGFSLKQLEQAVKKINQQEGDFVVFTGDLMDQAYLFEEKDEAVGILAKIKAGKGKLAVWGNHDYGGGGQRVYQQMMEEAGFTVLRNESLSFPVDNQNEILFTGLDDGMLGAPDYEAIPKKQDNQFHVLLLHEPDLIEHAADRLVDLTVSGHSHGGQIQLPFFGPLVTPPLARKYTDGLYELPEGKLYVNTGLGTTQIYARFLTPPAFTVFYLSIF